MIRQTNGILDILDYKTDTFLSGFQPTSRKPDHSTTGHVWTIGMPILVLGFSIQMVTNYNSLVLQNVLSVYSVFACSMSLPKVR